MATVRVTGIDTATGKERRIQAGDYIENLTISGLAMKFRGAIDGAGFPWPDEATDRDNGDTYTITAAAEITDPEGSGQTVQPGDEIVWDEGNGWWVVIGNADEGNVKSALLQVLTVDEDMLLRRGGDIDRLPVGANGNVLQVAGGQAVWANVNNPLLNVLTVDDDLLVRSGGVAARLPKGANDTVLGVDGAGVLGYKPDPAGGGGGSTPKMVEWWIATDGDDATGTGQKDAPFATLQKAIEVAHAYDNSEATGHHHHFRIAPGNYEGDGRTTFFGSSDGINDWSGDTVETMQATVEGEGESFFTGTPGPDALGNIPVTLGPIAIYACVVTFKDVYIKSNEFEGNYRPGLAMIDGGCYLRRCSVDSYSGADPASAVWLGIWDNYALSGPGLWGEYDFGGEFFGHEECVFNCGSVVEPTIKSTAFDGTWYGRDTYISSMVEHDGASDGNPGVLINSTGTTILTVDWKNVVVNCFDTWPAIQVGAASDLTILDCEFAANRPDIGDFYPNGWKYVIIITAKSDIFLDRNRFYDSGVGLDLTPGNCAVFISNYDMNAPANIYWGTNLNTDIGPVGSRLLKEAFFNVDIDMDFVDNIHFIHRSVMRQVWVIDTSGVPPAPVPVRGWDCLSCTFTVASGASELLEVIGNGGSGGSTPDPREQLPVAVTRDAGGGNHDVQSVVSAAATPAAGAFPTVLGGTDGCVAVQWRLGQVNNTPFGALQVTNKDVTSGDLRIIVPGAILARYIPS